MNWQPRRELEATPSQHFPIIWPYAHTRAIVSGCTTKSPSPAGFDEVLALIEATRSRVVTAVNTALIDLYWRIGQYISRKIAEEGWGQGTVAALAEYIRARGPNAPRIFRQQSLADDAVLRSVSRSSKTRTAGASFVVDPQPPDHEPQQAG